MKRNNSLVIFPLLLMSLAIPAVSQAEDFHDYEENGIYESKGTVLVDSRSQKGRFSLTQNRTHERNQSKGVKRGRFSLTQNRSNERRQSKCYSTSMKTGIAEHY